MTTTPALTARLEIVSSKMDINGNRYWAFSFTDYATGKTVCASISGGHSNISAITFGWSEPGEYDRTIEVTCREMPIRAFNKLTKSFPYAGCTPAQLREWIKAEIAKAHA